MSKYQVDTNCGHENLERHSKVAALHWDWNDWKAVENNKHWSLNATQFQTESRKLRYSDNVKCIKYETKTKPFITLVLLSV